MARHPVRGAADRRAALPHAAPGRAVAGSPRRRAVRAGRRAGVQRSVHGCRPGRALRRGLPDDQCRGAVVRTDRRAGTAGDGLHPRRRLQHRLLARLQRSGRQFRAHRQGHLRQFQLSARSARIPGLLPLLDAPAPDRLEPGTARSDRSAALGAAQHPRVRRRPRPGDRLGRVRRRQRRDDADGDPVRPRTLRAGDRPERSAERRVLACGGGRVGRGVRRDPAGENPARRAVRRPRRTHRSPAWGPWPCSPVRRRQTW